MMPHRVCLFTAAALSAALLASSSIAGAAVLTENQALFASNGATGDSFGIDVAVDGNYAIVGAMYAENPSDPGVPSGSAYIFEYNGSNWAEKTELFPSMGSWDYRTGDAVDISGDTAVVASYHAWSGDVEQVGMATVFQRDGGGNWNEVATLWPSDGMAQDYFGVDCAVDGDNIIIGAFQSDPGEISGAGSVYVYNRNQGGTNAWGEVTKLTADPLVAGDYMGQTVDISGNTIVAGAYNGSHAYIFDGDGAGNWTQTAVLSGSGRYGTGACIDGDRVVVGAYQAAGNSGRAYVYERNEGGPDAWGQTAELQPSNGGGAFGYSADIAGDTILVGAINADPGGVADAGAAYVYKLNAQNEWVETTLFTGSGANGDVDAGRRVALTGDGNTAFVGAPKYDGGQTEVGAALVYTVPDTTSGVVYPGEPGHVEGGPVVSGGTVPYAWYRADSGVGELVDIEGRSTVFWWADQSGNDRHLDVNSGNPSVVTDAETGKDCVAFDGNDTFVGTAEEWGHAAAGTVFCVWKATGFSSDHAYGVSYVYDGSSGTDGERSRQLLNYGENMGGDGDADWIEAGSYDDDADSSNRTGKLTTAELSLGDSVLDQWFVTTVSMTSGVDDVFRLNGEEVFSGDLLSSGLNGVKLGTACTDKYEFIGEMCEFIVFEGELTETEIAAIEQQLMARWGLGGSVPLEGDLNGDGLVGSADLDIVRGAWGESVTPGCLPCGDPSGDGMVGSADLDIVRGNWGATSAAAVPEPGAFLLLAAFGLIGTIIRRR